MILGNKCDVNDKRQVSKERGEKVGVATSLGRAPRGSGAPGSSPQSVPDCHWPSGLWGRVPHGLYKHMMTHPPSLYETEGLGLRAKGEWKAPPTPVGLHIKSKREGFWGARCVIPYDVGLEPVEATGSRGESCGLSQAPSTLLPGTLTTCPPLGTWGSSPGG